MARCGICPKCYLNYINLDTQDMCDICKKTILGERTIGDDLLLDTEFDDEELHSPFVAKTIDRNEQYERETHDDDTDDDNATWRGYVDIDDDFEQPDFEIDEEFEDEPEEIEDEEDETQDEDDFEYVSADDYCADDDDEDEGIDNDF